MVAKIGMIPFVLNFQNIFLKVEISEAIGVAAFISLRPTITTHADGFAEMAIGTCVLRTWRAVKPPVADTPTYFTRPLENISAYIGQP